MSFNATSSTAPPNATYTWDFGDGSGTTTGQKVSHAFSKAGVWVVRLTITDGNGAVRIMGLLPRGPDGSNGDTIDYLYRRPGAETWEPLSKLRNTRGNGYDDGFDPYAIDRKLNVAYGFDQKDGRQALYRVAPTVEDAKEGLAAYVEKRPPTFTGK